LKDESTSTWMRREEKVSILRMALQRGESK
jgi:hypothetical protein